MQTFHDPRAGRTAPPEIDLVRRGGHDLPVKTSRADLSDRAIQRASLRYVFGLKTQLERQEMGTDVAAGMS